LSTENLQLPEQFHSFASQFVYLSFKPIHFMPIRNILLLSLLIGTITANAQNIPTNISTRPWKANWIAVPGTDPHGYGVYRFRKSIWLDSIPASFLVHVSADNRYKLFVNAELVCLGPARGEIYHWNYETTNLAPKLRVGENTISAIVWNTGDYGNEAQISFRTAFILQGNTENENIINSDSSWRCSRDESYSPFQPELIYTYYAAGPGEKTDLNKTETGWKKNGFNTEKWKAAAELFHGLPKGVMQWTDGWMLQPRKIPPMEMIPQRLQTLRKADGISINMGFPSEKSPITIPAGKKITLLFDQGYLTNGYPYLKFSGGKNARITIGYAEALYIDEGEKKNWRAQNRKGNRNETAQKRFSGVKDEIISNGLHDQEFSTLWWRTWRYMQLEVVTGDEALVIEDLYGIFSGFPFTLRSSFEANDKELDKILETGWRTARLCAMETYMDCPYYEQLQYVGDTRIQALVSLYNSGDDRLMRNAIELLDESRMAEGITQSRYPTAHSQQIPPFSLWWISMIHDYWKYRNDPEFVKSMLPGIRQVLQFFQKYQQQDGSLLHVPYWNFTDWAQEKGWNAGVAPIGVDGNSAAMDLQLLNAYQLAAELEQDGGMTEYSLQYRKAAEKLQETIIHKYWNQTKDLFADISSKELYSQHVNALAILTGTVNGINATRLAEQMLRDSSITPATIYFKYYVNRAVIKSGLGDLYLELLGDWKHQLANGLTTWAEISDVDVARSDCHAWGSSPNIELYRTVLGIDSDAPGFNKVKVEPHLGKLLFAKGSIPHPNGTIKVEYDLAPGKRKAIIDLPPGTTGIFVWKEKSFQLKPGISVFNL
jgi:alpha-L-rhamnosidase